MYILRCNSNTNFAHLNNLFEPLYISIQNKKANFDIITKIFNKKIYIINYTLLFIEIMNIILVGIILYQTLKIKQIYVNNVMVNQFTNYIFTELIKQTYIILYFILYIILNIAKYILENIKKRRFSQFIKQIKSYFFFVLIRKISNIYIFSNQQKLYNNLSNFINIYEKYLNLNNSFSIFIINLIILILITLIVVFGLGLLLPNVIVNLISDKDNVEIENKNKRNILYFIVPLIVLLILIVFFILKLKYKRYKNISNLTIKSQLINNDMLYNFETYTNDKISISQLINIYNKIIFCMSSQKTAHKYVMYCLYLIFIITCIVPLSQIEQFKQMYNIRKLASTTSNSENTSFSSIISFITLSIIKIFILIVESLISLEINARNITTETNNRSIYITDMNNILLYLMNEVEYTIVKRENNTKCLTANNILTFDNVTFKFQNKIFFENINIAIDKPKSIQIIGPSGSGKSTFINILLRNANINTGDIFLYDNNIDVYQSNNIGAIIIYVPQAINKFTKTLLQILQSRYINDFNMSLYNEIYNNIQTINDSKAQTRIGIFLYDFLSKTKGNKIILFDELFAGVNEFDALAIHNLFIKYEVINSTNTIIYSDHTQYGIKYLNRSGILSIEKNENNNNTIKLYE